ncbi:unnamed protein product [Meloidogyne enterolobii]|uniref:Uncharacterized protein n=1 Tax=Meloidogyne enterolobii TaxID=390850 RepID=A0ACB0YQ86_MELEN
MSEDDRQELIPFLSLIRSTKIADFRQLRTKTYLSKFGPPIDTTIMYRTKSAW